MFENIFENQRKRIFSTHLILEKANLQDFKRLVLNSFTVLINNNYNFDNRNVSFLMRFRKNSSLIKILQDCLDVNKI